MPKNCCKETVEEQIKVEENSKAAIFLNPKKKKFICCQIDGCEIKQKTACDWFLQRELKDSVLVELKGRDISHAIDQIEATFQYLSQEGRLKGRRAGLIVGGKPSNHPAFTSKVQRAKNRLLKGYGAPLHIVRDIFEDEMDPLFEFVYPKK